MGSLPGPRSLLYSQQQQSISTAPTGAQLGKLGETASPCFPPVMFLQPFSLWPSADGLQGKRDAAVPLCSLVRYANASVDISFEGKKKKKLSLLPLLINQ